MGRHTEPGTGRPTPDRGFWVRLAAAGLAGVVAGAFLLTRGGDEPVTTAEQPTRTPSPTATAGRTPPPSSTPAAETGTPAATSTSTAPGPATTKRPPTLSFVLKRASYITVRVPGGRTLVSKTFAKGARRSFDQKVLEVVNGRPSAVTFTVNGKPRKPGPADQPETFTVRRR